MSSIQNVRAMRGWAVIFVFATCATLAACSPSSGAAVSAPLAREACGCTEGPPPPPGMDPATTCYDGCNWCTCTADGLVNCTARSCLGDAGPFVPDDAH